MYSRVLTASLYGLTGEQTWVEVDVENGLPNFNIVGLANQSIREAKDRLHPALTNCGFDFDQRRITVNLTPASKKKEGSHFDLPIAIGLLLSTGQLSPCGKAMEETAFLGELTLDGRLVAVDGVLPMLIGMQKAGVRCVVVPEGNRMEASLIRGMSVIAAQTLTQVTDHVGGFELLDPVSPWENADAQPPAAALDFADIRGQEFVKRAAQIAAAGMHGMLLLCPIYLEQKYTGIMHFLKSA